MKRAGLTLLMGLGLLFVHAQNEKNLVVDANAEVRNVSGFTAIEVSDAIDLYISQGTGEAVAISGSSDDIKARIKTEVRSGTLHIYFDGKGLNWKRWGNNRMKAYVTYKTLQSLEASGACNVKTTDAIRQTELKMEMSGASDFTGEVAVTKLHLSASGASRVKISGTAGNASFDASGACDIKAYDLITDMCRIDASGASNIRITVNKELNAKASGGSNISYRGTGLIRDLSSSGGASIKRKVEE
ncbi:MAG: head GIN domain-containing protein [Bacteroidota bacterium]